MLLQQKSNVCSMEWAVSGCDTDIRNWKDESYNGKIFGKVSPAVLGRWTMYLKSCYRKRFWKTGCSGLLLLAIFAKT